MRAGSLNYFTSRLENRDPHNSVTTYQPNVKSSKCAFLLGVSRNECLAEKLPACLAPRGVTFPDQLFQNVLHAFTARFDGP